MNTPAQFNPNFRNHTRTILLTIFRVDQGVLQLVHIAEMGKIPGSLNNLMLLFPTARNATGPVEAADAWKELPDLPQPSRFTFFDWALEAQSGNCAISSFPAPGVILAIYEDGPVVSPLEASALRAKLLLENNPRVTKFLASHEARFVPLRDIEFDAFLSYSTADLELAKELKTGIEKSGKVVFLAEQSIPLGVRWEPEIREALSKSCVAVFLITPKSVSSPWVIFEAGAAWALDIPIAAALSNVYSSDLPAAMSHFQSKPFESAAQRKSFVKGIIALMSSPSKARSR